MSTPFDPVAKLLAHPDRIAALRSPAPGAWKTAPVGVEISPTNSCNARCPWCFYVSSEYKQHHSQEEMPYSLLCNLIASLHVSGVRSITWTGGGEPSTYYQIDRAIDVANVCGIRQGMFTNGYVRLARPELLDWIRITVTEQFKLTKHVATYAALTEVGVNFNVTNANQEHLRRLIEQAIHMGVRYFQVRPALADTWEQQEPIEFPDFVKEYENQIEIETTPYKWRDYLKPHGYETCLGHRLVPFVWYDGRVSVCAYHKNNPAYDMGDLTKETWEQVWTGERRKKMLDDGVAVIPSCQHCCKLHEVNKILAARPRHEDFP